MLKLKPKFVEENGKKKFVMFSMRDFAAIQEALEDAEDARILDEAIREEGDEPRIPWAQVKRELAAQRRTSARGKEAGLRRAAHSKGRASPHQTRRHSPTLQTMATRKGKS